MSDGHTASPDARPSPDRSDHRKGFWLTLIGVLAICPDTLLLRLVEADIWTIVFWRGLGSGTAILLVLLVLNGRRSIDAFRSIGRPGLVLAVMFGVGTVLFVTAIHKTSVANTLFIISTAPLFAAIMARLFLDEPVSWPVWLSIAGAMFGIALMASASFDRSEASLVGDLMALANAVTMAATFTIARRYRAVSMVPAMALANFVSAIIGFTVGTTIALAASDVLPMAIDALLVVPIGFALLTLGPRYLPAPQVSLLLLAEAVIGPLLVWHFLGEHPGERALLGGAIVLIALAIPSLHVLMRNEKGPRAMRSPS